MKDTKIHTQEFNQLVTRFEQELIKENNSDLHIEEATRQIKELFSYLEQHNIESLKAIDQKAIDTYIKYLEEERISQRSGETLNTITVNKHKNAIRKFWKYLHAEQIKVKAIRVKNKKGERKTPIVLTHQEIEQLYTVTDDTTIGHRDRAMLSLYYGCGIRRNEGIKLLITDIDFNKSRIYIRTPKNKRDRYVMMTSKVQRYLEEYVYTAREMYLPEQNIYEELFIGERGYPIGVGALEERIQVLWKRVKENYGNDKHIAFHTLRHSLGTHLYIAGMEIEMIALMLGHQSLEATQLYIHLSKQIKK